MFASTVATLADVKVICYLKHSVSEEMTVVVISTCESKFSVSGRSLILRGHPRWLDGRAPKVRSTVISTLMAQTDSGRISHQTSQLAHLRRTGPSTGSEFAAQVRHYASIVRRHCCRSCLRVIRNQTCLWVLGCSGKRYSISASTTS